MASSGERGSDPPAVEGLAAWRGDPGMEAEAEAGWSTEEKAGGRMLGP